MNYMNDTLTPSDIEITRVMRLDLTADQWGLFFDEDVPATQSGGPGRSEIARILNLEIAQEFSYHEQDPALALEFVHQVLKRFQVYGAADTEGYMTVDAIAGVFFGEDAVLHYKGR